MRQLWKKSRVGRRPFSMRMVRRLVRKQDGSTAIEFGALAMPFVLLVFGIIEVAFIFFAGQTLETAVADSGRLIMTGQAQNQGFDQAAFKNAVCAKIHGLFDCQGGIRVDVRKYPTFSAIDLSKPVDESGKFKDDQVYQPGGPSEIVVVRLFYQWPVYFARLNLANMSDSSRLLTATSAFRNEPYAATSN
jgi:hypothetical protein